jgi:hypothetical protein
MIFYFPVIKIKNNLKNEKKENALKSVFWLDTDFD